MGQTGGVRTYIYTMTAGGIFKAVNYIM